jgi:uncharacterized membrane protein YkvA (DUF1232 family)
VTTALIVVAALIALYGAFVLGLYLSGRHSQARALAAFVPHCAVLFKRLISDPRVPRSRKLMLGALALYLASPIDLVPDFIPVAGQLDDAILVGLALRSIVAAAGPGLVEEHWPGPRESLRVVLRLAGVRST